MTQDEHRDDATQRDDEAREGRGWRNLGGFAGRFRRQTPNDAEHEAPPEAPPEAFPETSPGNEATEPGEPPPPVVPAWPVPSSPLPRPHAGAPVAGPDEDDNEEPASQPEPHPDLHPALRRDETDAAAEAAHDAEATDGTDIAATDRTDGEGAAADASTPPALTGVTSHPVVEERFAVTPRPMPPPPEPRTDEEVADPETPEISNQIPVESASADESHEETDLRRPDQPPAVAAAVADEDERRAALARRTTPVSAYLAVLTGVATMAILAFVLIEPTPRWLLIFGAGTVVLGLDGTLRQTWREPFSLGQETAPFLFVPALYMLSVPVIIEHNFAGEAIVLAGIGAGLGFGALAWAELASVRALGPDYPQARTIVTANTYLAGFAIFSLTYVFDISLPAAIAATGIAAAMLAVEVLREGEIDPMETLGLSLVTGVVLAEARWLFYYVPLDTYLAGLALLLVFYLCTGLLHSHIVRAMRVTVAAQYGGIAIAGFALVIFARSMGLA